MNKQTVLINFNAGLDLKADPFQLPVGEFLALNNGVFDKAGGLIKRNGFNEITTLPNSSFSNLVTLNDNLIATGTSLYAFSEQTSSWMNQGPVTPVSVEVQSMVRTNTSQTVPDGVVTSSGLSCIAYFDTSSVYYNIIDSLTGQQVVGKTAVPTTTNIANFRVLLFNNYFLILFTQTVSATSCLRYIKIPVNNPTNPSAPVTISNDIEGLDAGYDCVVATGGYVYIAWGASSATDVKTTVITKAFTIPTPVILSGASSTLMSLTVDNSPPVPVIWLAYYDIGTQNAFVAAYSLVLDGTGLHYNAILAPTKILDASAVLSLAHMTSLANNGVLTVFYEVENTSALGVCDYINKVTVTQAGSVGATTVMLRSVGLSSKAFYASNGIGYMLVAYGNINLNENPAGSNQPTYFLVDTSGNIYLRLAYGNGGGYTFAQGISNVTQIGDDYFTPYLITDLLASTNKDTNVPAGTQVNNIYTQTGVNLAKFTINTTKQQTSEIAGVLNLTGGLLWQYDGVKPTENNFHVYPENIVVSPSTSTGGLVNGVTYFFQVCYEWTDNQGNISRSAPSIPVSLAISTPPANFTANRTSGNATLSAVSSYSGLQVGQKLTGTGIPANTFIVSLNSGAGTLLMSHAASSGTATATTITPTAVSAASVTAPTLRLTYKTAPNPVRIVLYRWSTAQPEYHRATSLTAPIVNDPTVDTVVIDSTASDSTLLGNELLYTTGGVVENIAPPASIDSALYQNRVMLIDAEDPNLIWYSKQVIQNTPVEFSDLFTLYVAPTTGAQGSTGKLTCISAMDDKFIMFKKDAIYYLTGQGPNNTGGQNDFSEPTFITSAVGCSNPNSIVLMPEGLMFQSDKGIWLLGRDLSTKYIGDRVEAYNDRIVESALTIPGTNQVRFTLDNKVTLMYDYYYNRWGTFSNLTSISDTLYRGAHTYLSDFGVVYQETPDSYTDGTAPVLMSFTTGWLNAAGLRGYERLYKMFLLGVYFTPFKLNVQIGYDFNSAPSQSIIVSPDNFSASWGGEAVWGSGGTWGGPGNIFQARVDPAKQKCQTFQLIVNEMYDPTLGVAPGQGLSFSGVNLVVGVKKGYSPQKASRTFG